VHDVELRLHKQWATYAQSHRWHDSQVVDVANDHVRVRMRVRVCPELEAWILGFGEQAEVLAPPTLRAQIATRATALRAIYGEPRQVTPGPSLRKASAPAAQTPARGTRRHR